jgi:hypothetical protein
MNHLIGLFNLTIKQADNLGKLGDIRMLKEKRTQKGTEELSVSNT